MIFPFTAIVGQEKMKKALILNAINPKIGGVLLSGDKGTGKSTMVRALADVLPEIEVSDCIFNCSLDMMCDECKAKAVNGKLKIVKKKMRVVDLPISATEDRVVGSIDVEKVLKDGIKAFQPGILAEANNNVLYIDEVNLLDDHIVDTLLDVAASGWNVVEREGVSLRHPSRFILVGSMNPEEGELRPQILDRFGMVVNVKAIKDADLRAEIIRRVEMFSEDPINFLNKFKSKQEKLKNRIKMAREILKEVSISNEVLKAVAKLCSEMGIETHRADIITVRAAKALAAFNGRKEVTIEDVMEVAELTLPHRLKSKPFEEPKLDFDKIESMLRNYDLGGDTNSNDNNRDQNKDLDKSFSSFSRRIEKKYDTANINLPNFDLKTKKNALKGKRVKTISDRGKYVDFRMNGEEIAINATIRAALCRGVKRPSKEDYRYKLCLGRSASSIVLLVDASSSMAALKRVELAKGVLLRLLQDAYVKKDRVSLIMFKNKAAELIVPPTSSPQFAMKKLEDIKIGGKTPLAEGLIKAYNVLKTEIRKNRIPILVLVTDGRANVSRGGNIKEEIYKISEKIAQSGILTIVFDADDYVSLGYSREISEITNGLYFRLKDLNSENVFNIVNKIRG